MSALIAANRADAAVLLELAISIQEIANQELASRCARSEEQAYGLYRLEMLKAQRVTAANERQDRVDEALDAQRVHGGLTLDQFLAGSR